MLSEAEKIQKRKEKFAGTFDSDLPVSSALTEKEKRLNRLKKFGELDNGVSNNKLNKDKLLGDVSLLPN